MKFQKPSMQGSQDMTSLKKHDGRTNGITDEPKAICPTNVFKVLGIITVRCSYNHVHTYSTSFLFSTDDV